MKPKQSELPSVYDEKKFKKVGLRVNLFYLIGALVILLVVFRFINLTAWWFVTHLELTDKAPDKQVKYSFLHLSNYEKAKKRCLDLSQRQYPVTNVTVVSYFNFLQPAVFLVHTKAKFSAVDLGRVVVPLDPGLFTFRMYLSDVMEKQWDHHIQRGYLGTSILLSIARKKKPTADKNISFIMKSMEKSTYLKIPYLVYFYLPLVLIFILASFYTPAVFTSFFYYPVLFLLFDFKNLLFTVPFNWLTQLLKIKDTSSIEGVAAVVVVVLFTLLGFIGLVNWKKRRDIFKEKLMVLFFILLPIFLRF
ncbi:MAG: hypothetical protein JSV88_25855 [Candidatus Aminicenantes bacterium]|nr:MAG: hypothetical protein JSV88_25855 [Candidatus Aminicenantes bacterium]